MKEWQFWLVTALGGIALVAVLINITLFLRNRKMQVEVNNRQIFINQSMQLEQLNREIINGLANLAVKNDDQGIKQMLAGHGITITGNPPPADPADATKRGRK